MTDSRKREPLTLKRWSQRKLAAAREAPSTAPEAEPTMTSAVAPQATPEVPSPPADGGVSPPSELPSVDSLTIDSDFTAFMRPDVDESLKRGALRKLFSDPRFNVMDGLDVYIDDYSKPDPISPDIVRQLMQARYIFDPPATRVTADGHVEDVPAESATDAAASPPLPGGELPAAAPAEPLAPTDTSVQASEPSAVQSELQKARDVDSHSK